MNRDRCMHCGRSLREFSCREIDFAKVNGSWVCAKCLNDPAVAQSKELKEVENGRQDVMTDIQPNDDFDVFKWKDKAKAKQARETYSISQEQEEVLKKKIGNELFEGLERREKDVETLQD